MPNSSPEFVHLHMHTQYSLLDGAIRFNDLFTKIKEYNMDCVAITDHGTMFGVVEFYEAAKKAGIKPILGCEVYVAPRNMDDRTPEDKKKLCHLVLLAKNLEGYRNLCKLVTIAQFDGFYYKPRVDKKALIKYNKGLIALSACLHGEIPRRIVEGDINEADKAANFYRDLYGHENFYLEVQHNKIEIQTKVNLELLEMSKRLSIPLVATNDCHYLNREDSRAHEVLLCIQTAKTMNDPKRFKFDTDELFLKSPEEMKAPFLNYPDAIKNTLIIAEKCNIDFGKKEYHFPQFNEGSALSMDEMFQNEVRKGYETRMQLIRKNNPDIDEKVYNARLEYEIKIIIDMGFPGYFLIVADFIRYSKENGVPVGPGRGSAAGSIVAYSMGITELDPIEHGLIFERFLNPARASMPDIDVDFCINGRAKVFDYVVQKYGGGDFVSQIITFGKLKARAVIRDVGRALDIPLREVDVIAKLIPEGSKNLEEALANEPKLLDFYNERPEIKELITVSKTLEGLPRHASTHAAGVVISDKPLVEYLPLFKGKKDEVVTQFDMNHVEHIGLVKFDFLGLRNLTIIESAMLHIKEQGKTLPDLVHLDLEDSETYKLLSRGDTTGVFQLESSGMKDLLSRLKPECFNDITALVALYRPGPLDSGMVDSYVERKHGREAVEYLLPELEPILSETYGVILYQEQVMKIAGVLANYSMADADGLRKAMGKKIPSIMAEHRQLFMKGAKENNLPLDKAQEIFSLMEKFGGYGFNKSHSAAYALIAYHTAYLKTHFLVEFMAALLTSEMHNIDGVVKFMSECKSLNVSVLPPDINESDVAFKVIGGKIRFGLVAVKNVGANAIDTIIKIRNSNDENGGKFNSLFDFCQRVSSQKVTKRVIEALIKCGAFDSTGAKRSQMFEAIEEAMDHGQIIQKEKADAQMDLFGDIEDSDQSKLNMPVLPELKEWDDKKLLMFEKEILGFYITGHPLNRFENIIKDFTNVDSISINEGINGQAVRIGGIISRVRSLRTKKGDLMAFISVEDLNAEIEVVVFPNIYENCAELLFIDSPVIIEGELQKEENQSKILAEVIVDIDKAKEIWTSEVNINIDVNTTDRDKLLTLRNLLMKYQGSTKVVLYLIDLSKFKVTITCSDEIKVKVNETMVQEIVAILGKDCIELKSMVAKIAPKKKKNYGYKAL